jgi:hypothetical protein
MLAKLRSHVRSHSVAYVALFFALGGTAVAAGITGKQIRNNSVTGADVKESSLVGVGSGAVMARINSAYDQFLFGAPAGLTAAPAGGPSPVQMVTPAIGLQLRDLQVRLTTPPGAGNERVAAVGVVNSDGSIAPLQCLMTGAQTSCTAPGPLALPAGSLLVAITNGSAGTATSDVLIGYRVTPAGGSQAKRKR